MQEMKLENSPITYFIENSQQSDWVVFFHAAFVDHRMFNSQFEYFSGKYNLLAIDLLGHGKSMSAKKNDTIEKISFWINEIFEKHNISSAHFVGISLGAVFVQDFANRYANKVLSLACFGGYDINDFDIKAQKENSGGQMKMMLKAMFSIKWFAKDNKKISAYTQKAQDEFYNLNLGFKKKSFMYLSKLKNLVNKFPKQERNYPLLIGCGEKDIPMEIEIVKSWAKNEPCKLLILEGAGHCVNMDRPNEFNKYMEEFWQSVKK